MPLPAGATRDGIAIRSDVLGLELHLDGERLRLFDPASARHLPDLDEAERVVVFTGAGISTESGIPDFRSPGTGIWNKVMPMRSSAG